MEAIILHFKTTSELNKQTRKSFSEMESFFYFGLFELFQSSKTLEKLIVYEPGYWAQQDKNIQNLPALIEKNSKKLKALECSV